MDQEQLDKSRLNTKESYFFHMNNISSILSCDSKSAPLVEISEKDENAQTVRKVNAQMPYTSVHKQ